MLYKVRFTREAKKDIAKLSPKLKQKLKTLIQNTISINPCAGKKLVGDLTGFYSIRLSYQDRIVYTIDDRQNLIYIHHTKTHYGEQPFDCLLLQCAFLQTTLHLEQQVSMRTHISVAIAALVVRPLRYLQSSAWVWVRAAIDNYAEIGCIACCICKYSSVNNRK